MGGGQESATGREIRGPLVGLFFQITNRVIPSFSILTLKLINKPIFILASFM
jgi:hypothetical protein